MVQHEEDLKKKIDYWHTKLPSAGVRKLRRLLLEHENMTAGRKLIRRLMAEMGIYTIYPKPNLSRRGRQHKSFPYLLKNKSIDFPNQVWAIDVSYIPLKQGHMYLTGIIDWHSRYIVGWALSDTLDSAPIIEALRNATEKYGIPSIINSDQGSQFTSEAYINLLRSMGIHQSMDGRARWVDNVIIERWFRSLKTEYVYINDFATPRELRRGIEEYINDYNNLRPHQSLGYDTPKQIYSRSFIVSNTA